MDSRCKLLSGNMGIANVRVLKWDIKASLCSLSLLNFPCGEGSCCRHVLGFLCTAMNKSYSVTDWAMHDGDSGIKSVDNNVRIWALNLQDQDDDLDIEPEERAKFRHQSQNEEADVSDLDLNKGEDDLDSGPFVSVDEKMKKQEEEKEKIELPLVIHAKSPSPLPEDIGNPAGCVRRTLELVESVMHSHNDHRSESRVDTAE
uniref:Uncharacterized protein LOC111137464 n=1 Tax=Crassostrea virginica TaxID=6565 RepID=A0A8B8EXC3_CRAVI|nr:uncharacterized protein LOC111137464 [Crassostrea virginica]